MLKKFLVGISISLLVLGSLSAPAFGASNSIISGLNKGVNIATGESNTPAKNTAKTPVQSNQTGGTYAALGDSVAAGLGLASVPNPTASDTQCGRSSQSYPYLVAAQTQLRLTHIACSGATAGDLFTQQRVSGANPVAQLDTAFASGTPQLITITAGANDVHWAEFIRACYAANCATETSSRIASAYLTALKVKLTYAFSSIAVRSNGSPPTVIVTGYYNPLSNACKGKQSAITDAEINFLNQQRTALNQTIRSAASNYPFITYASTDFTGHGACSTDPWVQGPSGAAPFHPTATGQSQIAQSILTAMSKPR